MRRDSTWCLLALMPTRAVIHRISAPSFALWGIALRLSTLQQRLDAHLWVKDRPSPAFYPYLR
jgi:hypothetical protein